ncbi:MAG: glycosyltransferase family 2 protein [Planctomycetes bacterium]|nr:glycosyltransferase family 2 protein [Planctomycetota bacterium]
MSEPAHVHAGTGSAKGTGSATDTGSAKGTGSATSTGSATLAGSGTPTGTWAVVLNWNGGEQNLACVRSLLAQGLAPERIVFVDNASSDGSAERVVAEFGHLVVLRNAANLGYGDGTNRGIEHALAHGAERVLLVNNDVIFPSGTLAGLERALAAGAGIVGPRVLFLHPPDVVWCAGGLLTFRTNLSTLIGHREPDGPRFQVTRAVDYVPGCAMLVARAVFARIGLLEGDYFAYHEDLEFCWKARQAGFPVRVIGALAVHHDAHSSTGGGYNPLRKYMMAVNTVRFLRRHGTPARWLSFWLHDVLSLPFVFLYRAQRGEGRAVLAKARGTWDGLRGRQVTAQRLHELSNGG